MRTPRCRTGTSILRNGAETHPVRAYDPLELTLKTRICDGWKGFSTRFVGDAGTLALVARQVGASEYEISVGNLRCDHATRDSQRDGLLARFGTQLSPRIA